MTKDQQIWFLFWTGKRGGRTPRKSWGGGGDTINNPGGWEEDEEKKKKKKKGEV